MEFEGIDKSIDVIGTYSPYPEIKVRDTLKEMEANQILQVLNTDRVAAEITIPHYCDQMGFPYKIEQLGESLFEVLIRKVEMECGDRLIDVTGQFSPLPEIRTRDALKDLAKGQSIGVLVSDGVAAKKTIPHFCEKQGYEHEVIEKEVGLWLILIKK